jgi:hypothetical protein
MLQPPWQYAVGERSDGSTSPFLPAWTFQPSPQDASGKTSPAHYALTPGIWLRVISAIEAGLKIRTPP